jgi:hypothetical protein
MAKRTDTCPRCKTRIRPGLVGCKACWYALPAELRARVNEHFQPGQSVFTASAEYRAAYLECLAWFREHPISEELRQQLADSLDVQRQNR